MLKNLNEPTVGLKLAGLALLRLFCGEESNKKRAKAGEVKAYTGRGRQLVALIVEVAGLNLLSHGTHSSSVSK